MDTSPLGCPWVTDRAAVLIVPGHTNTAQHPEFANQGSPRPVGEQASKFQEARGVYSEVNLPTRLPGTTKAGDGPG